MCFVLFGCIRDRLVAYKLGAKRAELLQKFVPLSRVGIFLNERTRSTPLDPKHIFLFVSYNFSAVGTIWLARKT